jgi:deoxyribodipyrimidine photo-lyase
VTTIVWFRQDLRLADNPALSAAVKRGEPVVPVYIWAPEDEGEWPPGAASRWWLHQSLRALDAQLRTKGSQLVLAAGRAKDALASLVSQTGATAVYWNRRYEPAAIECAAAVEKALILRGIEVASFNSALLAEPNDVLNLSGKPYRVYTPYLRRLTRDLNPPAPLRSPSKLTAPKKWPASDPLDSFHLMPKIQWYVQMAERWRPGEAGAHAALKRFLRQGVADYRHGRARPAIQGTSGLSPHLHFGEIGPRQIWHALGAKGRTSTFLHEIVWREFAHHLLYHFPQTTTKPLRPEFAHFPWKKNAQHLKAWQRGQTRVPMVDAGMRELWATGVMHNRVRMIVGSFLVKNLLQPWQDGSRWFWETLLDADLANNSLNWQWIAGSGADAAPYFRIFNPVTQGERFDPEGDYVRKWVPEIAAWPAHSIHGPWRKSRRNPQPAPEPIVDLGASREFALDAYADMRRRAKS